MASSKITRTLEVLRRRAGLSQQALAESVELNQPNVSMYERGLEIPTEIAEQMLSIVKEKLADDSALGPLLEIIGPDDLSKPWEEVFFRRLA